MPHAAIHPMRFVGLTGLLVAIFGTVLPATAQEKLLTDFSSKPQVSQAWAAVNDTVMGGVSEGRYTLTSDNTLLFRGDLSLDNNGGFASIRTRTTDLNLRGYDAIAVRVKGDGRTYNFDLRTAQPRMASSYRQPLDTQDGEWIEVRFPIQNFYLTSFGRRVNAPPLQPEDIASFGFTLSDKDEGPFSLEIGWVKAINLDSDAGDASPSAGTLVDVAAQAGRFSTLLAAVDAAGLTEALNNPDARLTVFAPTDEAFAALPPGTVESLLEPQNKDQLIAILSYHVLPAAYPLNPQVQTLQGQTLTIQPQGDIKVGPATVLTADIPATNGIIHAIDRVLLPPANERTPAQNAMQLIELAIQRGVPQFNGGNPAACAAIYEVAVTSLLALHDKTLADDDIRQLQDTLEDLQKNQGNLSAADQAWRLRDALDRVYASLKASP